MTVTRQQFARELRERLPKRLRDIVFEVDVAAEESRAFNPMTETADILIYDPLEDRYQQSRVLDLFKRLPCACPFSGSSRTMRLTAVS